MNNVPITGSQLTVAVNTVNLSANSTYSSAFSICYANTTTCIQILVTLFVPSNPASPPQISTTSLPAGTLGLAYSTTIYDAGGQPPFNWSLNGSLPPGLTLNYSNGRS